MVELDSVGLFAGLTPQTLALLRETFARISYSARSQLILEGEAGLRSYVLLSGYCRVRCCTTDGREFTYEILGPGSVIGEVSLMSGAARSASVESLTHSTLLVCDSVRLREILAEDAELCLRVLETSAHRLRKANARMLALACSSARERVIFSLLHLAEDHGSKTSACEVVVPFRLTQSEIGKMAGVSRETCSAVVNELSRRNAYRAMSKSAHLNTAALAGLI